MILYDNFDLVKNELQNIVLHKLGTAPSSPVSGQMYYNTTDNVTYQYDGIKWKRFQNVQSNWNQSDSTQDDYILNKPTLAPSNADKTETAISGATAKTSLADADTMPLSDSAASNTLKKITYSNIKASLKTYFDTLYTSPTGNAATASKLQTARTISLTGDATGSVNFDGSVNASIAVTITDDSHNHIISNIDGLQTALDLKAPLDSPALTGIPTAPTATTDTNTTQIATLGYVQNAVNNHSIPIASSTVLGGIKVGMNLSISSDGTLNANDNPANFIIKQEIFTATAGQTLFTLTKGTYEPNANRIFWYWNRVKQSSDSITETSSTQVTLPSGVISAGDEILFEYFQLINASPYPIHASEHLTGGTDPIPVATESADGLMASTDKTKLDAITGTNTGNETTTTIGTLISGATAKTTPADADMFALMDSAASNIIKKLSWANTKATLKTYFDTLYASPTSLTGSGVNTINTTGTGNILNLQVSGTTKSSFTSTGSFTGNAASATILATGRTLSATGDATGTSGSFNGSANFSIALTLANSGVTAGTYTKLTVDAKGRATVGALLTASDIPTLTMSKISDAGTAAKANTGTSSGNVPVLDANGKLSSGVLPSIAVTNTSVVATQTAMLALTAQTGDIAIRTDLNKTYILTTDDPTTLANWQEFLTPTDTVTSVAGMTGAVTLTKSNVGLANVDNTADSAKNVLSATKWTTARTLTVSGDTTGSVSFDGSAAIALALTHSNSGVTAGTYKSVTVNAKGHVTAGTNPTTLSGYGITDAAPLSHTSDSTVHITAAERTSWNAKTSKISFTIGDDLATSFTLSHNLGTEDITVSIRDTITSEIVYTAIQISDSNSIVVSFTNYTPTSGQFKVIVIG